MNRSMKRSYSAVSSSSSGSSFDAPNIVINGTGTRSRPLWKIRSLMIVNSALRIDELALKISSRKAMCASGSLCVVTRR